MYDYLEMKRKYASKVSSTIDSPIMVFDYWEFSDALAALLIIMVFGVIFYSWALMFILLFLCLVVGPLIKRRNYRGIFLHWPYRYLGLSLPGMFNPKGTRKFSD